VRCNGFGTHVFEEVWVNTQALVAAELAVSDKQDKYAWFGCMTATCLFPLRLRIHKFKALQLNSFS